ncbi:ArdC family protein [Subtercola sp. YIM 133946]|uniref:ArdC family protein n=1 Tax=Subtercola sp. YIM 133946 TaxID=3118909 RepID=UPI002F9533E4
MTTEIATRTSKTRTPAKTAEEKKAQAEALHQSITDQVETLHDSGRWEAFLDFAQAFHAYSLNNVLLILSQMPEASQVAGFRKWQTLNRQVRKGERGIRIFGYSTKKVTEKDANGDEVEKKISRFPILSVFDVSQTDLIDPDQGDPSTLTTLLTGADDHGIVDALSSYLIGEGWTVERRSLPGSINGVTRPQEMTVVVDSGLSPEAAAKTMIHECAHILLGHIDDLAEYAQHRGLMETEAESVAYVVAGMVGFDTSAYSVGYIAGWANADTDLIKSTAARVLRTAHQIAGILTPEDEATDDPDDETSRAA